LKGARENLDALGLGDAFLDTKPRTQSIKGMIAKLAFIKLVSALQKVLSGEGRQPD
jgi:hypothetical protein